jgi:ceramide glucosyltransferase
VFRDRATLRALWLLPLRDLAGLLFWVLALGKRTFVWRGHEFELTRGGRIVPRTPA